MATTYILYSTLLDKHYIGHTAEDLDARLKRHLAQHGGFTAKTQDWILVFKKEFLTKQEAYDFEREIKSWKSKRRIQQLIDQHKLS